MPKIRSFLTLSPLDAWTVIAHGEESEDITNRVVEMGQTHDRIEKDREREAIRDKTQDGGTVVLESAARRHRARHLYFHPGSGS